MQITPLSQNNRYNTSYNTNFKGLHVSPQALEAMGITREALLKNYLIRNAADTFEVLVKPSKQFSTAIVRKNTNPFQPYGCTIPIIGFISAVWGGIGMIIASILELSTLPAFLICAAFACGTTILVITHAYDDNSEKTPKPEEVTTENLKILVQCGEKYENGKLSGITTEMYEMNSLEDELPDITSILANKIHNAKFATLNPNDLFTSDKYLSMLKELRPNKDIMHKKVNEKGDTLLTQFFEVSPDENRTKYKQIISILKNIRGLDYNQEAAGGVSCLQRIMYAENFDALELVKDFEFNYKPELTDLFVNIQNQNFKEEVLKLNIKFNDILKAVEVKSDDALKELEPQLDSPLCNREKLAKEIEETLHKMNEPGYAKWFKSIYLKYMNTGVSNLID